MADDPWKAAGFTQEQPPAPQAPIPAAPAAPAPYTQPATDPKDPWATAGLQRVQGDGSPTILPQPAAVKKQAELGQSVMKQPFDWAGRMSPLMQSIHAGLSAVPDAMQNQLEQGAQSVSEGEQDILQNRPATGVLKIGSGLMQSVWSPVLGFAQKVGEQAEKVTGDPIFGEKVALLTSLASPMPYRRPLITTSTGDLVRLYLNEAGQIDAQVIGKPPVAADFHAAAQTIVRAHETPKGSYGEFLEDQFGQQAAAAAKPPVSLGEVPEIPAFPEGGHGLNPVGRISAEQAAQIEQKLHDYWNDHGVHPAEAAEIAKTSPAHAADLSSARTGPLPLPDRPSRSFLNETSDMFFALRGAHTADQEEVLDKIVSEIPTPFKDGAVQDRAFRAAEGDTTAALSPEEQKLWNTHVQPWRDEATEIYKWLKGIGLHAGDIEELDPNYMTRMVVGKTPEIDRYAGENAGAADPVYGPGTLARTTRSMRDRSYFAIQNAEGERKVVRIQNLTDGATLETVSKTKGEGIITHSQKEPIHPGDALTIAGDEWHVTQALTREIEGATNLKYYKNGILSVATNLIQLRAAQRVVEAIQRLKDTPEWAKYTSVRAPEKENWIQPQMPLLRNFYMEPKLAYEIDDFWGRSPQEPLATRLEQINSWAIKSMFWTPIPHALNAGSNWFVGRSWDWINPVAYKRLAQTGARAIYEVASLGKTYQRLQRDGASLIYGGLANRDYYDSLIKATGAKFATDKNFLEIAKDLALAPEKLVAGMYNLSAKGLWSVSDMFTVQRVLELEEKGMTTAEAIKSADKTLVNYRLPTTMLSSRILKQKYADPSYFEFSRYHWGVLRAYGNMAKDIATGTAAEKADAVGRIMALGVLQLTVWPALSAALQDISGNPDLQVPSFGLGRLAYPVIEGAVKATQDTVKYPPWVLKYYNNDKSLVSALYNLAPFSPGIKLAMETYNNRTIFNGKQIVEPSDWRNAGVTTPEGREASAHVAVQQTSHALGTMVEPYNMVNEAWKNGTPLQSLILQNMFGLTEHTDDKEAAKQRAFHYQDIEAKRRHQKPTDVLESLVGR